MTTVAHKSRAASVDLNAVALTAPAEMVLFFTLWAGTGVLAALIMIRRGHDVRATIVMGMSLGPLMFVRALDRHSMPPRPVAVHRGAAGPGSVDVLVAVDGGDHVVAAADVVALLGERIGRLTLARSISIEDAEDDEWTEAKAAAVLDVELAASFVRASRPSTVLVPGRDVRALLDFAARDGYDVFISDAALALRRRWRKRAGCLSVLVLASAGRDAAATEPS